MLHVIEIRTKALSLSVINSLANFFTNSNHASQILTQDYVEIQLQDGDITGGINRILNSQWNAPAHASCTQYTFTQADKQIHVILMTDILGARFVLCTARSTVDIEKLNYAYVGYDAPLSSVNQMFAVTRISSDDWRYSVN